MFFRLSFGRVFCIGRGFFQHGLVPIYPGTFNVMDGNKIFHGPFGHFGVSFAIGVLGAVQMGCMSYVLIVVLLRVFRESTGRVGVRGFFNVGLTVIRVIPGRDTIFPFGSLTFIFMLFTFIGVARDGFMVVFVRVNGDYFFMVKSVWVIMGVVRSIFVGEMFGLSTRGVLMISFSIGTGFMSYVGFKDIFMGRKVPLGSSFFMFVRGVVHCRFTGISPGGVRVTITPVVVTYGFFYGGLTMDEFRGEGVPNEKCLRKGVMNVLGALFGTFRETMFGLGVFKVIVFYFIIHGRGPVGH